MMITSNAALDDVRTKDFLEILLSEVFVAPNFSWRAASIVGDTYGPESGYSLQAFFYDDRGAWVPGDFIEYDDGTMRAIYAWIEETYHSAGKWFECLIQMIRNDGDLRVHLEFEFKDIDRWGVPDDGQLRGNLLRPAELPTPLGSGLRES